MSETLTRERIVEAIQNSKATTISGVWKYLGHKSAISGDQSKRIKNLVPNHLELLEANKNGTLVKAEKTEAPVIIAVQPPVQSIVATATPAVETVAPKKITTVGKKEKVGGFRAGSHYAVLFAEGNKGYTTKEELIARVAKLTGRSKELVTFDLNVMKYTSCKTNAGRAKWDESKAGKIKIIPA